MVASLPGVLGTGGTFPLGWAILLILAGFFALASPFEVGMALAILVAAFVIVAGIAHLARAFAAGTTGNLFRGLLAGGASSVAYCRLRSAPGAGWLWMSGFNRPLYASALRGRS